MEKEKSKTKRLFSIPYVIAFPPIFIFLILLFVDGYLLYRKADESLFNKSCTWGTTTIENKKFAGNGVQTCGCNNGVLSCYTNLHNDDEISENSESTENNDDNQNENDSEITWMRDLPYQSNSWDNLFTIRYLYDQKAPTDLGVAFPCKFEIINTNGDIIATTSDWGIDSIRCYLSAESFTNGDFRGWGEPGSFLMELNDGEITKFSMAFDEQKDTEDYYYQVKNFTKSVVFQYDPSSQYLASHSSDLEYWLVAENPKIGQETSHYSIFNANNTIIKDINFDTVNGSTVWSFYDALNNVFVFAQRFFEGDYTRVEFQYFDPESLELKEIVKTDLAKAEGRGCYASEVVSYEKGVVLLTSGCFTVSSKYKDEFGNIRLVLP